MDWPNWVVVPILAFYAIPFWLRIVLGLTAVALLGRWLL